MKPTANIVVKDPHNGSTHYVNGNVISVDIDASPIVDSFLLSESVVTKPEPYDPRFSPTAPNSLNINSANIICTTYLWIRSVTDDVNDDPIISTISILPETPIASVELTGIIENGLLLNSKANVSLATSRGIDSYFISDTQTSFPGTFTTDIPSQILFTNTNIIHTAYIWLKDKNDKTNQTPFVSTIYIPPDDIVCHRPRTAFVDDKQQGLIHQSKTLKAVNQFGDYVKWVNITFDPVGKNFSGFKLERNENGYTIYTPPEGDCELLANNKYWDYVEVSLENVFRCDPTICYNNEVVYSNNLILMHQAVNSISISPAIFKFSPYNMSGGIRVIDFISDERNQITLQVDNYDFFFLKCILKNRPLLQTNYDAFSDTQMNYASAESVPVSIEIYLSEGDCLDPRKEVTLLTRYCQSEITFTKEELDRIEDFGFTTNFTLNSVSINKTSLRIRNPDDATDNHTPSFEFEVINPPNSYSEFTLQIDTNKNFTSPTNLAFRIKETNNKLLILEGSNFQEISFSDNTPLPYGTIFWRVRRNQSDFTEPAMLTIRSAPVVRLEFTTDSVFSEETGTLAHVKVKAFDYDFAPVEGAKISIDELTANTDSQGIAEFDINMPVTKQEFGIEAISENATITQLMSATDSPHLESKISFNKISESCIPINRYIIFRKLLAEVRSELDDKILMVSQTPDSPVERRDSYDRQPGVKFDPDNRNLKMARDLLPPKRIKRINIVSDCCNFDIAWHASTERGTTWHYDGKSVSNQNFLSENFAITAENGHKFDVISAFMANNKTISPSPYETHGQVFPAYKLERIDANLPRPDVIITDTITNTAVIDTNHGKTFFCRPAQVTEALSTLSDDHIMLQWTNPNLHDIDPGEFVYRVKSFDIAGNHSISNIFYPPETIKACMIGILVTRINSTECFEEIIDCVPLDCEIELAHGSVLAQSVVVSKMPEYVNAKNGPDFSITDVGDENTGRRAKIIFHKTGIISTSDTLRVCYRYARAIDCGLKPTPHDFIVMPYDGTYFAGPGAIESVTDNIHSSYPMAYTYGIWVVGSSGKMSDPIFTQILIDQQ